MLLVKLYQLLGKTCSEGLSKLNFACPVKYFGEEFEIFMNLFELSAKKFTEFQRKCFHVVTIAFYDYDWKRKFWRGKEKLLVS